MLTECPECNNMVSTKAVSCPRCGYPLKETAITHQRSSSKKKHMRLPNGFGRITYLKGRNLRKPYRVMVSTGKDEFGKPIGKLLKPEAYFETYNEAYAALIKYHDNPYEYDSDMTVNELYEKWFEAHKPSVSSSRQYGIKAAYDYCHDIIGSRFVRDIKAPDIRRLLDKPVKVRSGVVTEASDNVKKNIKYVLSMMFDYAVEYGYADRNVVRDVRTGLPDQEAENPHISYSKEELEILWKNAGKSLIVDMILVQCYMGWRPNEMCNLLLSNVNMTDYTIKGGSKTKAGKEREVPIHSKIRLLIQSHYNESILSNGTYLFVIGDKKKRQVTYQILKTRYKECFKELGISDSHRLHDGRKTFVTLAKEAGVDEYAIKLIVGHAISDITERVYTERSVKWLRSEISKIK